MSRRRQLLRRALPALVSAAALAALLATVDASAVADALSWRVARVLAPALLLYGAVTLALEAVCLRRLVGPAFGAWTAARIKCASYLLGTLHYALGVGALTLLVRGRAGISLGDAASAVLLIFAADVLVVLAFASAATASLGLDAAAGRELPLAGALAVAGLGCAAGLALLRARAPLGPLERIRTLPFFRALASVPLPRLAELLALRLLFSMAFIGLSAAAFLAFELRPPLAQIVLGMMLVAGVSALPIAIAGLGTGQAAFVFLFRSAAEPETLLALSLVLSAGMIALRVGMGLLFARELSREALALRRDAP